MSDLATLNLKFLGTSSAVPLPTFECLCFNCDEARYEPALRRTRSSIAVVGQEVCLVDAGPDLEQQMEREGLRRIDRLFITHWHTDHISGLGGLGMHQTIGEWPPIKLYLPCELVSFFTAQQAHQLSSFELHPIQPGDEIQTLDAQWEVVKTNHSQESVGYIIHSSHSVAYLCDGITPPQATIDRVRHSDVLVLEATMDECDAADPAHFTAQQAAEFWEETGVEKCILTHASFHSRIAGQWAAGWPAERRQEFVQQRGVIYARDGLVLSMGDPLQVDFRNCELECAYCEPTRVAYYEDIIRGNPKDIIRARRDQTDGKLRSAILKKLREACPEVDISSVDSLFVLSDGTVLGRANLANGRRVPFHRTRLFLKGLAPDKSRSLAIINCGIVTNWAGKAIASVQVAGGEFMGFSGGVLQHNPEPRPNSYPS